MFGTHDSDGNRLLLPEFKCWHEYFPKCPYCSKELLDSEDALSQDSEVKEDIQCECGNLVAVHKETVELFTTSPIGGWHELENSNGPE